MHDTNGQFLSIGDTVSFTVDIFDGDNPAPMKSDFKVQGVIKAFAPNMLRVKVGPSTICDLVKVRPSAVLKVQS